MDPTVHELTAAYALDALDEKDEREYEQHLRTCARCREELASLQGAAESLAFGVAPAAPPPGLRERILREARAERPNVVPLRPRTAPRLLSAVAAVAACVAIGLGIWAVSLSRSLADERQARDRDSQLVAILADPAARRVPVSGERGTLVVSRGGEAALLLSRLAPAPEDKTYEAWVIAGGQPRPAGLFEGSGARTAVRLTRPVPRGATVAVTVEPEGGVARPTGEPLFTAKTTV